MRTMTRFALPEVHSAFMEWRALTGHGWDSPEWSDTLAALDRVDLLAADQAPQPQLWDTDAELAELPGARRLRAAILGAARVWHDQRPNWRYDLPTTAEIMIAHLSSWPAVEVDGPPLPDVLLRLEVQVPRQTGAIYASRSDALGALMGAELHLHSESGAPTCLPTLTRMVLREAVEDEAVAVRVLDRLAAHEEYGITVLPLSDGRWVMVHA